MFAVSLVAGLFLWGLIMSFLAFQNKSQVILIGKTDEAYKLITEQEDKGSLEAINFIRHFIALTLNFDEKSYIKHISLAGDLMSENLWSKKKTEFKELASFVKKNKVIQTSELLSIKKTATNNYLVEIKSYLFKNEILTEKNKTILISLTQNQRSYENSWGYNVSKFEIK